MIFCLVRKITLLGLALLFSCVAVSNLYAQRAADQLVYFNDNDYKVRVSAYYWHADPSGDITELRNGLGTLPFNSSNGFDDYPAYYGEVDWLFAEKQHVIFDISPNSVSKTSVIKSTIVYQGATYTAGATVTTKLNAFSVAPGYQFDFIRNARGHLGVLGEVSLLDVKATLDGAGTVSSEQGTATQTVSVSKSEFVPLPALGLEGKFFLRPYSTRFYLEGNIKAGYYFGYGHSYAAKADLGINVFRNLDLKVGYLLGDNLSVNGITDNTQVNLKQDGVIAGLQYSF
jgi:hypothetical protein